MPATEETYRRQPTLHLVFAISSIAMLLSTVWMVMADHLRPWKQVQREFQSSSAKSSRRPRRKSSRSRRRSTRIRSTRSTPRSRRRRPTPRRAAAICARSTTSSRCSRDGPRTSTPRRRFQKADLDSKRSFYDGMIDRGEEREARSYLSTVVAAGRAASSRPFRSSSRRCKADLNAQEGREGEAAGLRR